jgi:hypothetical protein
MYHQNFSPSHGTHHGKKVFSTTGSIKMNDTENLRMTNYSQSPNAVTASSSPNSPSIRIANSSFGQQRLHDHPHEIDLQEFEAEADYKEYIMYQRIMQHRNSYNANNSLGNSTPTTTLIPPVLPLSTPIHPNPSFLNAVMIQRLRDNANERQNSFYRNEYMDQVDTTTTVHDTNDDLESEEGIFELDM